MDKYPTKYQKDKVYKPIINETGINIWEFNAENPDYFNLQSLKKLLGHSNKNGNNKHTAEDIIHEVDYQMLQDDINQLETNKTDEITIKYNAISNHCDWRLIRTIIKVLERDGSGKIKKLCSQHTDITFQEKIPIILNRRKNQYLLSKKIIEETPVGIALIDPQQKIKMVNLFMCKLLGYSFAEFLRLSVFDLIPTKTSKNLHANLQKIFLKEISHFNCEVCILNVSNKKIWLNISVSPVDKLVSHPELVIMTFEDINRQKLTKDELIKSKNKFKSVFNSGADAMFITDKKGNFKEVNKTTCMSLGYKRGELLKKNITGVILEDQKQSLNYHLERIIENKNYIFELTFKSKSNATYHIELNSCPILIGSATFYLHITRDISERLKMRKNIINAIVATEEKERRRFARDLHDGLGPILSAAKLYIKALELIDEKQDQQLAIKKALDTINDAVSNLKEISYDLSPHILKDFGLIKAITKHFYKLKASEDISISIDSDLKKRLDPNYEITIYRILAELFNNTLKYSNAREVKVNFFQKDQLVTVVYEDDGKGFDLEQIAETSQGQGMSNIQSRIESLHGQLALKTSIGNGIYVKMEFEHDA